MRIISGEARGRKITPPLGMQTRPTLDRIKESMFNIIQMKVRDSVVIDLFSGTGSLGLEAVSRGAKRAYLIEKDMSSFKLLNENVKKLKFEDRCMCINGSAYNVLEELKDKEKFNIIFIDPPYCKDMIPPAIELIYNNNLLYKDGIIVTKIDSKEVIYNGYNELKITDIRKYGNTTVCFYEYEEE